MTLILAEDSGPPQNTFQSLDYAASNLIVRDDSSRYAMWLLPRLFPMLCSIDVHSAEKAKHYPPGNHYASHFLKCPISRS